MAATALPRFDREALARFLAAASGAGQVEMTGLERLPGGALQENWGLVAEFAGGSVAGMQRLVLRTDALTGIASSLGRIEEFAVLRAAHAAGVAVPEPLWACADPAVIGRPAGMGAQHRSPHSAYAAACNLPAPLRRCAGDDTVARNGWRTR